MVTSVFGMTPSSSVECETKLKLLTGKEQIFLCQILFLVSQERTLSPSHPKENVCTKRKEGTLHLPLVHDSQESL